MPQINLSTGVGGDKSESPIRSRSNASVILSLLIVAVSIGGYFGVVAYHRVIDKKFSGIQSEISAKKSLISGSKANRVADFSDRLSVVGKNLSETSMSPNEPLTRIESSLVPGVVFSSYEYDAGKKTVSVMIMADSFRSLAEELVALKQKFSSVQVDKEAKLNDDGEIEAGILMML